MSGIWTGSLRVEGLEGFEKVLAFRMEETPGNHSVAELKGYMAETTDGAGQRMQNRIITVHTEGEERPIYSGMVQKAYITEENGLQSISIELVSGTKRMDLVKKDHSYQDTGMSYGSLIEQVAAEADAGAIYPSYLDNVSLGTPRIQYRETDWEFLKRMASHFNLSLYPEATGGGARIYVGIPEVGKTAELNWTEYTAVMDDRYYESGGEEAGHVRGYFLSYEVESEENHACGEKVSFRGMTLAVCSRKCESRRGELIFTYRLATPEWAGQRRISNEKISGLSLLGTVLSRAGETLQLKLDIDEEHPDQNKENAFSFPWKPPTGNLMYLMPEVGSRVSLYFKGSDEESAVAVNCIRGEREDAGRQYRERALVTGHRKELDLHPCRLCIISLDSRVLLDDLKGLSIHGKQGLYISALGKVTVSGKSVSLDAGEGELSLYKGHMKMKPDGSPDFVKDAEIHLWKEGREADSLGAWSAICAYEREDYSGNEYRFRDDPVEENYDYAGLTARVLGGLVVVGGITIASGGLAAGAAAAGASVSATAVMGATATGGTFAVAGLAASDLINRRVSSMDDYVKTALAGSIVGAMTGAAEMIPAKGLARAALEFGGGAAGSAVGQLILDGEVDAEQMFKEGLLAMGMAEVGRWLEGGEKEIIFAYADGQLEDIPASVWSKPPVVRGKLVDDAEAIKNNLGYNFPTVDSLYGTTLASTKSYDTTLPRYLDADKWLSVVKRDVNKLNRFTKGDRGGSFITVKAYDEKCLNVILPNVKLTGKQRTALRDLKKYAGTFDIGVKVYITK